MHQLLATTTASLADHARHEKPPTDLDLLVLRHTAEEFLDALQSSLASPPGNLPRRADPVQYAALSATSWHDLALLAGVEVFGAMLMRLDHRTYFAAIERCAPDREKFTTRQIFSPSCGCRKNGCH
jgi:hypothetical protein